MTGTTPSMSTTAETLTTGTVVTDDPGLSDCYHSFHYTGSNDDGGGDDIANDDVPDTTTVQRTVTTTVPSSFTVIPFFLIH